MKKPRQSGSSIRPSAAARRVLEGRVGNVWIWASAALLLAAALPLAGSAAPPVYRCESADKKVSYSDVPCPVGKQNALEGAPPAPSDADRATALRRAREDKEKLRQLEAVNEKEAKREASEQKKDRAEKQKLAIHCAKLEVRLKREREDLADAAGRELAKRRKKAVRTEEDYASECGKK